MKITEVIYFGFELDLLEAHLEQHFPSPMRTIVVECHNTTTGIPKPLMFDKNKDRFCRFNIEHIILPPSTFPIQTKTFLEFKHQDSNAKNIIHKYASLESDWVFHNDTDEMLHRSKLERLHRALAMTVPETRVAHHHLDQRSPFVNTQFGTFHVHRIYRASHDLPAPKSVKRFDLSLFMGGEPTSPLGWHFTNCFSTPEELYWKIKTRNWIMPERDMKYCERAFRLGLHNLHKDPEFQELHYFLPTSQAIPYTAPGSLPDFMLGRLDRFPYL